MTSPTASRYTNISHKEGHFNLPIDYQRFTPTFLSLNCVVSLAILLNYGVYICNPMILENVQICLMDFKIVLISPIWNWEVISQKMD
jgi:hypothetical protein